MVVRDGLLMGLIGILIGSVLARALSHLLGGLLFGVAAHDTATFVAVPVLLIVVALLASWFPAARAARTAPAEALR